jgi:hypothetical protein
MPAVIAIATAPQATTRTVARHRGARPARTGARFLRPGDRDRDAAQAPRRGAAYRGRPRPAGAAWAVAQLSPVGAAFSAVETGCPAGMAAAPPAVSGSIVWASWRPPTCTRRGLAASATGIVSVSTPCS